MLRMQSYSATTLRTQWERDNVDGGKAMKCGVLIKLLQDSLDPCLRRKIFCGRREERATRHNERLRYGLGALS